MKPIVMLLAGLSLVGPALAGEVYVTRDAQGNVVYTDTPQTIPAQKLGIRSSSTDPAAVQARQEEESQKFAAAEGARAEAATAANEQRKAAALKAEDQAQRCAAARERYQAVMGSYRIFEEGPDGERRYLDSDEIDTARADAKRMVDEFCGEG